LKWIKRIEKEEIISGKDNEFFSQLDLYCQKPKKLMYD